MMSFSPRKYEEMWPSIAATILVIITFVLLAYQMFDLVTTLSNWREGNFLSVGFRDGLDAGLKAIFEFLGPLLSGAWMWIWHQGTELMVSAGFSRRTSEVTVALAGIGTYIAVSLWILVIFWRYASRNSGF